jgi:hypothetical protein
LATCAFISANVPNLSETRFNECIGLLSPL